MFDKLCRDTVGLPSGCSPILHQMVWLGMFQGGWNGFAAQRNKLSCRPTLGVNYTQLAPDEKSCGSWRISVTPKASAGCKSTLAFGSSHEARRRMAAFSIQLTRKPHRTSEPRGPSPSGGIFAANSHVSLCPCAPAAQSGVKGYYPLREARRRAAVFRSQVTCLPTPLRACGAQSGVKGYYPLREARRRAAVFRSQFTCLSTPLRAVGAQSEQGTQSPILPRTMKRAPSKV